MSNPENVPEASEKPETGTTEETSQQQETASEKPAETSSEFHIAASRLNQRLVELVKPDTAIDQPAFNINVRQKQEKAPQKNCEHKKKVEPHQPVESIAR